jgi:hypothetical protein
MSTQSVAFATPSLFLLPRDGSQRIGRQRAQHQRRERRTLLHACAPPPVPQSGPVEGVNIKKYASQRATISADKSVTPKEINDLFVRAGKPVRCASTDID